MIEMKYKTILKFRIRMNSNEKYYLYTIYNGKNNDE